MSKERAIKRLVGREVEFADGVVRYRAGDLIPSESAISSMMLTIAEEDRKMAIWMKSDLVLLSKYPLAQLLNACVRAQEIGESRMDAGSYATVTPPLLGVSLILGSGSPFSVPSGSSAENAAQEAITKWVKDVYTEAKRLVDDNTKTVNNANWPT